MVRRGVPGDVHSDRKRVLCRNGGVTESFWSLLVDVGSRSTGVHGVAVVDVTAARIIAAVVVRGRRVVVERPRRISSSGRHQSVSLS